MTVTVTQSPNPGMAFRALLVLALLAIICYVVYKFVRWAFNDYHHPIRTRHSHIRSSMHHFPDNEAVQEAQYSNDAFSRSHEDDR